MPEHVLGPEDDIVYDDDAAVVEHPVQAVTPWIIGYVCVSYIYGAIVRIYRMCVYPFRRMRLNFFR